MSAAASDINRLSRIGLWLGLAILLAAPFIGLYPIFMMKALCYAIFACAFNLLLGYTGLLSFGHAAYLGAAAYATGWLVRSAGWSPELGVLAGTLVAAACGLAALAGVLAAPVIQITPLMGSNLIIVVFAVVVIGGMGSILGSILTGVALGLIEGLTKVFYPEASSIVGVVIMAIVLMIRPAGLFGKEK